MFKRIENIFLAVVLVLMCLAPSQMEAQMRHSARTSHVNDTLSFKQRLGFRTNAIDWMFLRPNLGVEFDLSRYDYGVWTVGLDAVYNWNTSEERVSPFVYDVASLTLEGRRYFRTHTPKARSWRAYYLGAYAAGGDYSIKVSSVGHQGQFVSVGASFGFGIPMAKVGKNFVELDLGGRFGAAFSKSNAYTIDTESNCYPALPAKNRGWHAVPYPVVMDLHVSLVYRFHSIGQKYRKPNYELEETLLQRQRDVEWRRDSLHNAKIARQDEMRQQLSDIRKAKKEKKAAAKAARAAAKEALKSLRDKGRKEDEQ